MGAFELANANANRKTACEDVAGANTGALNPRRLREECIIALKVYDSCRHPHCKL